MPEAWGHLIARLDQDFTSQFVESREFLSWQGAMKYCELAGINAAGSRKLSKFVDKGNDFAFEAAPQPLGGGLWLLTIFGDEWMHLAQALVNSARNAEIYGAIYSEDGVYEYYARQPNGGHYFGYIAVEEDNCSEDSEEKVKGNWVAAVPGDIKALKPGLFEISEPKAADDSDEPVEAWSPEADEDFVRPGSGPGVKLVNEAILSECSGYSIAHLLRARELGATLVDPPTSSSQKLPFCTVHYVLGSEEIEPGFKGRLVKDLLEVFDLEIDLVCTGGGEFWGTALFLAAGEGLVDVVEVLLARNASPSKSQGNYHDLTALEWARECARNHRLASLDDEEEIPDHAGVIRCLKKTPGQEPEKESAAEDREQTEFHDGIRCPGCGWRATPGPYWQCECGHEWDTFTTRGACPDCGKQWAETWCPACDDMFAHPSWYEQR